MRTTILLTLIVLLAAPRGLCLAQTWWQRGQADWAKRPMATR